jgi:hypothetical protein
MTHPFTFKTKSSVTVREGVVRKPHHRDRMSVNNCQSSSVSTMADV